MKLKRLAVRVLVALIVVVALCMFFGQTVLTITTPKVKLVSAQTGKLEERIRVQASLSFEDGENLVSEAAKEYPVTVDKVFVAAGDRVAKGDTLFTATLGAKYDEAVKTQRAAVDKAREELVATDLGSVGTKLSKTGMNDAEDAYYKVSGEYVDKLTQIVELTIARGVSLSDDVASWPEQIGPAMTTEISLLFDELAEIEKRMSAAKKKLMDIRKSKKIEQASYEAIKKRRTAREKVQEENEKLVKLVEQGESIKTVRAPGDGVVLKVDVKSGETYSGDKPAMQLTATQPALRADISGERKQIAKDMRVDYQTDYETLKTKVLDIQRESGGKKYAVIDLTDELLDALGGLRELANQPVELQIVYKAKSQTTLLPESAVKGSEGNYYVFVAEEKYGAWGTQLIARKRDVKVIEHSDRVWSIEDDLSYQKIITQPNANIEDGTRVMEYE